MKDLLIYILENLVDSPDDIQIEEESDDYIDRFNVRLAQEDYPKVIGKGGMTIKAITDILRLHSSIATAGNQPETDEHRPMRKVYINVLSGETDTHSNGLDFVE